VTGGRLKLLWGADDGGFKPPDPVFPLFPFGAGFPAVVDPALFELAVAVPVVWCPGAALAT